MVVGAVMGWPTFAKKPPGGDVRPSVRKTTDSCMARAVRVRRRGRQEGDRSQSDRSVARRSAAAIRAIKARFPHRFSLNVRSSAYSFRGTRWRRRPDLAVASTLPETETEGVEI